MFNAEVYLAAAQLSGLAAEVSTALGVAAGTTLGKVATVLALRRGSDVGWVRRVRERGRRPVGPLRERLRHRGDQLLALLGRRRYGLPIVFVSSAIGVPPLFAVTLAVPATRMSLATFATAVLVGRSLFFLAITFGISKLLHP